MHQMTGDYTEPSNRWPCAEKTYPAKTPFFSLHPKRESVPTPWMYSIEKRGAALEGGSKVPLEHFLLFLLEFITHPDTTGITRINYRVYSTYVHAHSLYSTTPQSNIYWFMLQFSFASPCICMYRNAPGFILLTWGAELVWHWLLRWSHQTVPESAQDQVLTMYF